MKLQTTIKFTELHRMLSDSFFAHSVAMQAFGLLLPSSLFDIVYFVLLGYSLYLVKMTHFGSPAFPIKLKILRFVGVASVKRG